LTTSICAGCGAANNNEVGNVMFGRKLWKLHDLDRDGAGSMGGGGLFLGMNAPSLIVVGKDDKPLALQILLDTIGKAVADAAEGESRQIQVAEAVNVLFAFRSQDVVGNQLRIEGVESGTPVGDSGVVVRLSTSPRPGAAGAFPADLRLLPDQMLRHSLPPTHSTTASRSGFATPCSHRRGPAR
jgi:hypothetical protein